MKDPATNHQTNSKAILTPRTLGIFLLQSMSLVPFTMALAYINGIIYAVTTSNTSFKFEDAILVLIPVMIGSAILYFPQKNRTQVVINSDKKTLIIIKKGAVQKQIDTGNVKSIISKTIKTMPGCKHLLIFDKGSDLVTLFDEDTPFSSSHWGNFSEKLSAITNLPLKKEFWLEDYNGKLSLTSTEECVSKRKHGMSILLAIFTFSFLPAIGYILFPDLKNLILFGCISIVTNIAVSFYYFLNNREKFGERSNNNLLMISCSLTLILPFGTFYLIFVILLIGLKKL